MAGDMACKALHYVQKTGVDLLVADLGYRTANRHFEKLPVPR
jgi:hypothetical protein